MASTILRLDATLPDGWHGEIVQKAILEGSREVLHAIRDLLFGHAASTTKNIPVAMHKDADLKPATFIFWRVMHNGVYGSSACPFVFSIPPLRIKLPIRDNMFVVLDGASLLHGTVQVSEQESFEDYSVRGFAFYSKKAVWNILNKVVNSMA